MDWNWVIGRIVVIKKKSLQPIHIGTVKNIDQIDNMEV